jgi:hypothetical protein
MTAAVGAMAAGAASIAALAAIPDPFPLLIAATIAADQISSYPAAFSLLAIVTLTGAALAAGSTAGGFRSARRAQNTSG